MILKKSVDTSFFKIITFLSTENEVASVLRTLKTEPAGEVIQSSHYKENVYILHLYFLTLPPWHNLVLRRSRKPLLARVSRFKTAFLEKPGENMGNIRFPQSPEVGESPGGGAFLDFLDVCSCIYKPYFTHDSIIISFSPPPCMEIKEEVLSEENGRHTKIWKVIVPDREPYEILCYHQWTIDPIEGEIGYCYERRPIKAVLDFCQEVGDGTLFRKIEEKISSLQNQYTVRTWHI